MYSTTSIIKNSKHSGKLVGTHQKLDRAARLALTRVLPRGTVFPSIQEILHFEGMRGPDGLKSKSPGQDEPEHFIIPAHDDGRLIQLILDHHHNLRRALAKPDSVRAAFEAAWLAHAITDGLTPAHHFPLSEVADELMTDKEFFRIFGEPIKGLMRGETVLETARHNWLYLGAGGYMTKHLAFEWGVAITAAAMKNASLAPKLKRSELYGLNLRQVFYSALQTVDELQMYQRFQRDGWTTSLAIEVKEILLPTITRTVALAWASSLAVFDQRPVRKTSRVTSPAQVADQPVSTTALPQKGTT